MKKGYKQLTYLIACVIGLGASGILYPALSVKPLETKTFSTLWCAKQAVNEDKNTITVRANSISLVKDGDVVIKVRQKTGKTTYAGASEKLTITSSHPNVATVTTAEVAFDGATELEIPIKVVGYGRASISFASKEYNEIYKTVNIYVENPSGIDEAYSGEILPKNGKLSLSPLDHTDSAAFMRAKAEFVAHGLEADRQVDWAASSDVKIISRVNNSDGTKTATLAFSKPGKHEVYLVDANTGTGIDTLQYFVHFDSRIQVDEDGRLKHYVDPRDNKLYSVVYIEDSGKKYFFFTQNLAYMPYINPFGSAVNDAFSGELNVITVTENPSIANGGTYDPRKLTQTDEVFYAPRTALGMREGIHHDPEPAGFNPQKGLCPDGWTLLLKPAHDDILNEPALVNKIFSNSKPLSRYIEENTSDPNGLPTIVSHNRGRGVYMSFFGSASVPRSMTMFVDSDGSVNWNRITGSTTAYLLRCVTKVK